MTETRQIVVPGEVVGSTESHAPGQNTYLEGRDIRALRLGVKSVRGNAVNVIGLSGRYEASRGDMVIGTAVELGPSNWYIDIGAANDVGMHVNDVPWRVEFGETSKYIAIGETVLLKIVHVDEMKKAQVSMKDRQCRKLTGGLIWEVSPSKVPRIVGRNGSMIALLKDYTNVRIFVGQNGVVWLDGEAADVRLALDALHKIEAEAHTTGLTDRMKAWFEEQRPGAAERKRAAGEAEATESETPVEGGEEFKPRRERRERPRVERDATAEGEPDLERDRAERREGGTHTRHHSERRAQHHEAHHGRADRREAAREEPRGRPAREEASREPRRFEERRAEERPREERPVRRFEDERPTRRDDAPARRFEERPARSEEPRGRAEESRPPRREFGDERPMRREERREERPANREEPRGRPAREEAPREPRRFEERRAEERPREERPVRRFEEERPVRREERREPMPERPARRFEEERPAPREERPLRRDDMPRRSEGEERRYPAREERPKPRFEESRGGRSREGNAEPQFGSERPRPAPRFNDDDAPAGASARRPRADEPEDRPVSRPPARSSFDDSAARPARRPSFDFDEPASSSARGSRRDDDSENEDRPANRESEGGDRGAGGRGRRRGGRGRGRGGNRSD